MGKKIIIFLSQFGKFWQDKLNLKFLRWIVLLIVLQFGYLIWRFNKLPPEIPLYYSLPWGEYQIGSVNEIFILPGGSVVVWVINTYLAVALSENSNTLSRLLVVFSLVFSLLSAIAIFRIIGLVI